MIFPLLRTAVIPVLVVVAATLLPLQPAEAASTRERLDNIERKLDSRGLLDMLNRIEQMQRDLQELRGEIELQTHTLKDMQRRSREQYLDIDRRHHPDRYRAYNAVHHEYRSVRHRVDL